MNTQIKSIFAMTALWFAMFAFWSRGMTPVENPRNLTTEQQLPEFFQQTIEPFWQSHVQTKEFLGGDNVPIKYAKLINENADKLIVISPGRTEGYIKYKELAYDLFQQGYSVYIIDHRGQGLSGRMTKNPQKGHVKNFDDYVTDLKKFYDLEIALSDVTKRYLVCHSMGGAIGAKYLIKYQDDFDKAVFSSPMLAFIFPLPDVIADILIASLNSINQLFSSEPWYFPGHGDDKPEPFKSNIIMQSEARYKIYSETYAQHPDVILGGVTINWIAESAAAMNQIKSNADAIKTPFLLMQSGNDKVIKNSGQDKFCTKAPACVDGKPFRIENAYHELFMEQDQYRLPALNKMLDFLQD